MASVDGYTYILVFWHKYNKLWALTIISLLKQVLLRRAETSASHQTHGER